MKNLWLFFLLSGLLHALVLLPYYLLDGPHFDSALLVKSGTIEIEMPVNGSQEKQNFRVVNEKGKIDAAQAADPSALSAENLGSTGNEAIPEGEINILYPLASRKLGEEGIVELSFTINANGEASDVQITQSSKFSRLDQAAVASIQKAKFKSAPTRKMLKIKFSLKNTR